MRWIFNKSHNAGSIQNINHTLRSLADTKNNKMSTTYDEIFPFISFILFYYDTSYFVVQYGGHDLWIRNAGENLNCPCRNGFHLSLINYLDQYQQKDKQIISQTVFLSGSYYFWLIQQFFPPIPSSMNQCLSILFWKVILGEIYNLQCISFPSRISYLHLKLVLKLACPSRNLFVYKFDAALLTTSTVIHIAYTFIFKTLKEKAPSVFENVPWLLFVISLLYVSSGRVKTWIDLSILKTFHIIDKYSLTHSVTI